jgi:hypothetical protein
MRAALNNLFRSLDLVKSNSFDPSFLDKFITHEYFDFTFEAKFFAITNFS